jgi:hypothetical protein
VAYAEKRVSTAKGSKGKVTWRARYKKPDGTWGSEPGFPTKKTAEQWGEEQEAAIRAGRWVDPEGGRTLFGAWAREWMKAKSPRGRTVNTRWERLETHIFPRWEFIPLQEINWFEVEAWANKVAESHDDVTATHCTTLMSMILTGAVDAQKILVNPIYGRRRSRSAVVKAKNQAKRAAKNKGKVAPPELLLRMARRAGPMDGLHILTVGFLGPRWGESLALRRSSLGERREPWGAKDFTCPVLHLVDEVAEYQLRDADGRKLGQFFGLEPLKTDGSLRDVDVPPFLWALLQAHVTDRLAAKHEYLFCTRSGGWWRRSNFGRQVMRPVADGRAALPVSKGHRAREGWEPILPGMNMDLLRHTADSLAEQIGVKAPLQFEQAGHIRSGIKAVYQHPTPEMRIERLDGLEAVYRRAMANLGWESVWES